MASLTSIRERRRGAVWGCGWFIVITLGIGWWLQRPSYLELAIEIKFSPQAGSFWSETQFTQVQSSDSWGAVYVCRKTGIARVDIQGWKTSTDVLKFFHDWLLQRGWRYQENGLLNEAILPEGRFLQKHAQYRVYGRSGRHPWEDPWVVVVIDPVHDGVFEVTLITAQSSWLRRLDRSFED